MKPWRCEWILVGALTMATGHGAPAAQDCTPETIIINANIHTVDRAKPSAQAVAICGEVIHRVGTTDEIKKLAGPKTRVIDVKGRLVVPGSNDAHVHLLAGADELVGVDLRPSKDEQDLARRLAAHAAKLPKGRWIVGGYWDHEAWPSQALPTRQAIDAVTPDHPVFVQRLDGHMALANSLAITLAGVTRATKSPDGGTIVADRSGDPAGVFKDNAMVRRLDHPRHPARHTRRNHGESAGGAAPRRVARCHDHSRHDRVATGARGVPGTGKDRSADRADFLHSGPCSAGSLQPSGCPRRQPTTASCWCSSPSRWAG